MGPMEETNSSIQSPKLSLADAEKRVNFLTDILPRKCKNDTFESFFEEVVQFSKSIPEIDEPKLPKSRCPPWKLDEGSEPHSFSTAKDFDRQLYFEIIDTCRTCLRK